MDNLFSIIASLASIVSIPLAVYFFLKSSDDRYWKIRREIARILSFQIGDGRRITQFEIRSVINSLLGENRLIKYSITPKMVIEDVVAYTISSALLTKERKDEIVLQLNEVYKEIGNEQSSIRISTGDLSENNNLQQLASKSRSNGGKSYYFGIVCVLLTTILLLTLNIARFMNIEFVAQMQPYKWFFVGLIISLMSLPLSAIIKKKFK